MTVEAIQALEITNIRGQNLRDHLDQEALKGLAESIAAVGQLYPVRVRRQGETFVLIDGHRRTAALRSLGKSTVFAIIEDETLSDIAAIQKALVANTQREEVSPLATAKAIGRLMQKTGWKLSETAIQLGYPPSRITKYLAYLKIPPELASQLSAQGIGASVVYELARVEGAQKQEELARELLSGRITREQIHPKALRSEPDASHATAVGQTPVTRLTLNAGEGKTLSIRAADLSMQQLVEILQEVLRKARRANTQGVDLRTFARMSKQVAGRKKQ